MTRRNGGKIVAALGLAAFAMGGLWIASAQSQQPAAEKDGADAAKAMTLSGGGDSSLVGDLARFGVLCIETDSDRYRSELRYKRIATLHEKAAAAKEEVQVAEYEFEEARKKSEFLGQVLHFAKKGAQNEARALQGVLQVANSGADPTFDLTRQRRLELDAADAEARVELLGNLLAHLNWREPKE